MKVFGHFVYVFLASASFAHAVFYFSAMPDPMASHFELGGVADLLTPRVSFFVAAGFVFVLVSVIFLAAPLVAHNYDVLPQKFLESRFGEMSREEVWRSFVSRMAWAGNATLVFISLVLHFVFLANMQAVPRIDVLPVSLVVVGYSAFLMLWLFALLQWCFAGARK